MPRSAPTACSISLRCGHLVLSRIITTKPIISISIMSLLLNASDRVSRYMWAHHMKAIAGRQIFV